MRYILHYTKPGDIVFDGFCGTGMTGVAAQMCGSNDGILEAEMTGGNHDKSVWGKRYAVLNDRSPAATFIANEYNTPFSESAFHQEFEAIVGDCEKNMETYTERNIPQENRLFWGADMVR